MNVDQPEDLKNSEHFRSIGPMPHPQRHFPRLATALCCGISLLIVPALLHAGQPQNNNNRPVSKKGKASELPVVKSVTHTGLTVGDKYFEANDFTQVTVNGEKGDLGDIKPGMQASVTGGVLKYGQNREDTIYKATRIIARDDNQLAKKAAEDNKKKAELARNANQRTRRK